MNRTARLWSVLVTALALATVGVACGGEGSATQAASGNAADASFVEEMTAHHEGAVEMARMAQERAEHRELRELANRISADQRREIREMERIRQELPDTADSADAHGAMEMQADMDPAMLEDAENFDRAFIDMMIPHHEGAIAMAQQLLEEGEHPELRSMAREIIEQQRSEIEQMHAWRSDWYAGDSG